MTFAAIFVPDFPVEAVVRAEPELRGQAVAVVEGTPPLLNVVACNQRAREAGVEIGMTKVEAEARLAASVVAGNDSAAHFGTPGPPRSRSEFSTIATEGHVRRRSPAQELAAHAALIDCACAFSPRVEDNAVAPDTVVLDLDGLERLFGPPAKIARELARRASELAFEANVAVAGNVEAAMHAAHGFAGVTVIPPGEEAERLGTLPVEVLLDNKGDASATKSAVDVLDTLSRWGICTFRALAALPETAVRQRLGELGVRWQRLARGEGTRPLVPAEPPLIFEETAELEFPATLLEALSFLLNHLLEQLCARLNARALATQEIRLVLDTERSPDESDDVGLPVSKAGLVTRDSRLPDAKTEDLERRRTQSGTHSQKCNDGTQEYAVRLPVPMLDTKTFLKLLQLELRAKPPGAPVRRIFLKAEPVRPRFTQGGLFLPAAPEPEKLEVLLARIDAIVSKAPAAGREELPRLMATGDRDDSFDWRRSATPSSDCPITEPADELHVGAVELLDTHRPDAFRIKKFVPPEVSDSSSPVPGNQVSGTPTGNTFQREGKCDVAGSRTARRRFRPPRRLRVEVRAGRPEAIHDLLFALSGRGSCESQPHRTQVTAQNGPVRESTTHPRQVQNQKAQIENVLWSAGPWRDSGDWWTGEPWSREVWDVAVSWGSTIIVCRLFREVDRNEWFVEAVYD